MHRFLIDTWWAGLHLRVGAFPVLIFAGVAAGLWIVLRRARGAGLSPRDLLPVVTGSLVVGFLGARLGHVAQYGAPGGIVLYGGLVAGMTAAMAGARWKRLPELRVADLAAPAVLLAAAFGRLGCFMAGCCHGAAAEVGVRFPAGSPAFRDQLRHGLIAPGAAESLPTVPIALYEAIALLVFFVVTSRIRPRRPGTVLGSALLLYPAWRFVAEFWRPDNAPYWPGGLTFSQGISIACFAAGVWLLIRKQAASTSPASVFRPATAFQVGLALGSVCLSLSSVSCASTAAREVHYMQGVSKYRNPGGASAPKTRTTESHDDDDSHGWFEDCLDACLNECIEECVDACGEALCSSVCGGDDEGESTDPAPAVRTPIVGMFQTRTKYKGSLAAEVVVNRRLQVLLKLEGTLTAHKTDPQGGRPMTLRLKKVDLKVGEARWQGSGDLDFHVAADSQIRLVKHTLPADLMGALAALNDLTGNLLLGVTAEAPLSDLANVVQEELRVPQPHGELSAVARFDHDERWVLGEGRVERDPAGTPKLVWKLNY